MPKVSIIVPVYNVESFIRECLNSIQQQTFWDWECLLIDDGSPDNCGAICDEYAKKDSRFKVYHKVNGGVSSARNLGLDNACGEWVTFVDSDDFISPSFIEGLYSPIEHGERVDFVHGGCSNWSEGKINGINQVYEYYVGENPEKVFQNLRGLAVSKLFRLDVVKSWLEDRPLYFDEKMKVAEDMAFTLDYLLCVKRYVFVPEIGYYYRLDNMTSATKSIDTSYYVGLHACRHICTSAQSFIQLHNIRKCDVVSRLAQIAKVQFYTILSVYKMNISRAERLKILNRDWTGEDASFLNFLKQGRIKSFLAGLLVRKDFVLFDALMSIVKKLKY